MARNKFMKAAFILSSFACLLLLYGCSFLKTTERRAGFEERWGIRIESVRLTAEGYMMDFRYRIIDPEKAVALIEKNTTPYVVHKKTGVKMIVPTTAKVGPLRQRSDGNPPKAGRTYFMIFGNPGKLVKHGDEVTIIAGNFRAENLVVE